jgi:hypothetical protein
MAILLTIVSGSLSVVNNILYAAYPNDTLDFRIYDPDDPTSRVARGANVSQELVNAGIIPDSFSGKTCQEVQAQHERTKAALDFDNKDTLKEILGIP